MGGDNTQCVNSLLQEFQPVVKKYDFSLEFRSKNFKSKLGLYPQHLHCSDFVISVPAKSINSSDSPVQYLNYSEML